MEGQDGWRAKGKKKGILRMDGWKVGRRELTEKINGRVKVNGCLEGREREGEWLDRWKEGWKEGRMAR